MILRSFKYGCTYYPEHWDPSYFKRDLARMRDAGMNFIRIGEGAWSYWEPTEGRYQFDLFDRVIDLAAEHGIATMLGTPTYCAPAWVCRTYPSVLRWDFQRRPMDHGSRRNLNYTSPDMLRLSDNICSALARHYAKNKHVIGWQLDNEFNCHMDVSYAPSDTAAFRLWLAEKYGTIADLNDAWGTKFWSQTYDTFDQIDLPHPTATYHNPTHLLDESRFISDTVVAFAARQAALLRGANGKWKITHNGLFGNVDGPKLAAQLDFFSHDQYPLFGSSWTESAASLATARSLSRSFAVLEQQSGPGGQLLYLHRTPRPGEMRLWAWQSIVHGAQVMSFFTWRTCPFGAEQRWHGILDQDDRDNRRLEEASVLGNELADMPRGFLESEVVRGVAVLRDYDNDVNESRVNTYLADGRGQWRKWLAAFSRAHVPADVVWAGQDLSKYPLVIASGLQILSDAGAAALEKYVRGGGVLVLGVMSGYMNEHGHIRTVPAPGPLAAIAGVTVEDFSLLPKGQSRNAVGPFIGAFPMAHYVERLAAADDNTAEFAQWDDPDTLLSASAAMTFRRAGKGGGVYYLGGCVDDSAADKLAGFLAGSHGLATSLVAPAQVEVVFREGADDTQYLCLLNHGTESVVVANVPAGVELLTGTSVGFTLAMTAYDVAIIRLET